MTETQALYNVGGVLLERPFRVRRLGHFGLNVSDLEANVPFYRDVLGFAISDVLDFRSKVSDPERLARLGDTRGIFMRHGTDHHSFVLFDGAVFHGLGRSARMGSEVSINQLTFQVGSLQEVVEAADWLAANDAPLHRSGRDIPGSNWHSYFYDPEGHIIELYYGIEQIGWDGVSKPRTVHTHEFKKSPSLPQRPEFEEVNEALDRGEQIAGGYRHREALPADHAVDGVRLSRPFKIVAIGPVRMFYDDLAKAEEFWTRRLGLSVSERLGTEHGPIAFLRCGGEHHTIALYPKALRSTLPVNQSDTLLSFGVRLANYGQLRAARTWLSDRGLEVIDLPPALRAGIDRAFYVRSPGGHLIEFHWHMDMFGQQSVVPADDWPEAIDPPASAFNAETLLGPWA